jgi:hypothetical protein
MIFYLNNTITENTSTADLVKIGKIKLSEMETLPFIAPYYKGKMIPRRSMELCKEFGGDCFKYFN